MSLNCGPLRIELRLCLFGFAAQRKLLEDRHAERRAGIHGAVRVADIYADVAVIRGNLEGRDSDSAVAALRCSSAALVCSIMAARSLRLAWACLMVVVHVELIEGRVRRLVDEVEFLRQRQADGARQAPAGPFQARSGQR